MVQTDGGTETEGRHTEADNSISIRQITECLEKGYTGLMHWDSSWIAVCLFTQSTARPVRGLGWMGTRGDVTDERPSLCQSMKQSRHRRGTNTSYTASSK